MDPAYIDIDGLWPRNAHSKHPESALIANEDYARLETGGRPSRQSNNGLEPASVMLQLVYRKSSCVTNVTIERDALGVNRPGNLDRARVNQLAEIPGRLQV